MKRYPKEFKQEAVRLSYLDDRTCVQVADELGIDVRSLYQWRSQAKKNGEDAFPGKGKQTPEQAEISELKKKVRRLEQERAILKKAMSIFADREQVRYEVIESHRDEFPVTLLCEVLDVSTSGYYDWRKRPPSKRQQEDEALLNKIEDIHAKSRETYGSPRIHRVLKDEGRVVGRNRVARLMRDNGIKAAQKRRSRRTTDSNHAFPLADNLLAREFSTTQPNQVWLADITYVDTQQGWLYLAAILDIYSRKIVGWAMDETMGRKLCINALQMAVLNREPDEGLLHHSDRGCQYASGDYQELLKDYGMTCSMSRKGNCWDNAPMESFFGTLKTESLHRRVFATRDEARQEIFEYIEVFYNRQRKHSALDFASPSEFEMANAA
ncbi:IS3 family transposase [Bradymonas sediminis]|uniref:IS3 family transposase n=1 Tax=Bradymonas sediminis TaxID=1548548 RepID=A0A2Z4FLN9_9DELT|nr:IS3 family transposase [Bradymonas sediminis]AWV89883.1 IS3 family transposase [Bradymonas sediminis]